ncbi:MAG: ABC transporter permease [Actinomycetota bacterium]|jgi:ABC-2 type transport system permease protein|nr:ABC transporter permease [Acidimicrobiia bacterium]MDQ3385629.1 ABC transporter permease [Actinomycetota bacterium]
MRATTVAARREHGVKALAAQLRVELTLTARRGETLLLILAIPVLLLVFFSVVDVLPLPPGVDEPVDFLTPGIIALAVLSTGLVQTAIGTAFERQYGVLKRLAVTPLGRPRLLAAKVGCILVVEAVQVAVLVGTALVLGWDPSPEVGVALVAVTLGTVAFSGLGLAMAGRLRGEVTLAAANGLYLVLLLLGGMVFPLEELPGALRTVSELLPAAALSDLLGQAAGLSDATASAWPVLVAWAVLAPVVAALTFRWE